MGLTPPPADFFCERCSITQPVRHAFKQVTERMSKQPWELLHIDLCGSIEADLFNKRYFLKIIDDYSRYCTIQLLQYKSEAAAVIIEFIQFVEKRHNCKVKGIRSDNGREFENAQLNDWLAAQDIKHQKFFPYSSEQNGTVERLNRILIKKISSYASLGEITKYVLGICSSSSNND